MSSLDQHSHVPVEDLADHAEVSDPARLATIRAHLGGCAECRAVLSDLGELRSVLAGDSVGPMPAAVSARLENAIAAAAAGEAQPAAAVDAGANGRVSAASDGVGDHPRSLDDARRTRNRRRGRASAVLAAAATITAVVVGAAVLSQGRYGADDSSGAGAMRSGESATDARAPEVGGGVAADQLYFARSGQAFSSYTLSIAAQELLADRAEEIAAGRISGDSGYLPGPLAPAYPGTGGAQTGGAPPDTASEKDQSALQLQLAAVIDPAGLARCLAGITPDPGAVQVLAMDIGRYGDEPALLLVLSDPEDPTKAQVRLVGNTCALGAGTEFLRTEIRR